MPTPLEPALLPVIDLRGSDRDPGPLLPRAPVEVVAAARGAVRALVEDVAARGDEAVAEAARRFDGVDAPPSAWRATRAELAAAARGLDPGLRAALEDATARVRAFHQAQRPAPVRLGAGGARLLQRFEPLARAGVYVPGGRGAYPSTVVMNVVPAQAAGVGEVAVATPPGASGRGHPAVLGAAAMLGVEEVWLLGGAQAVAALALGTATVPAVDSVTGPGNLYVSLAKQEVAQRVRTDGFAGPTEVCLLADGTADPRRVACDLVAQAEHDPLAACLLVTDEEALWRAVEPLLAEEVAAAPHRDRVEKAFAGQSAVVLCDDRAAMLRVAEAYAPEHLELLVADARELAERVRAAGAVFVGEWTPVALGDYAAGTNHVLPTAGTARFAAGLSTLDFLRPVQVAEFDRDALAAAAPTVAALARAEDLPAHARAVQVRLDGAPPGGGVPDGNPPRGEELGRGAPPRGGAPDAAAPPRDEEPAAADPDRAAGTDIGPQALAPGRVRVRDDLADLVPYGAPQLDVPVRLNTNETPYPVPPAVLDDLADAVRGLELHRYPDREATALRAALADRAGHPLEGTWAANGSNELLQQLLMAYAGPGRSALVVEPSYAMHGLIARATGTRLRTVVQPREAPIDPARAAAIVAGAGADLTFWCSPNNPTGEAASPELLAAVCDAAPGLVVVDEAYGEFGAAHAAALLGRFPNLVVTRTFSKAFRMAGLRLGYLLAEPAVVEGLRLVRLPYHLSALTQAVGLRALARAAELTDHVERIRRERERLAAALAALPGVRVLPSDANFLCFAPPAPPRQVWAALLDRGVLVRDVSGYPTLDRYLRVTVGTPAEDDAFVHALAGALGATPSPAADQGRQG
jgi:histidinol dehydrogenase